MNQRLHMDSEEVEAKALAIDPAIDVKQLDIAIEQVRIGIGYINVLMISNDLVFGMYNEHLGKESETNKMVMSFDLHGIQSLKEENMLCMIVKQSRLTPEQSFDGQWIKEMFKLKEIQFRD